MRTITITQDGNSPMTREQLMQICTPDWTKGPKDYPSNINGNVRVDDVVQLMSLCAGLLLEHLNERLLQPQPNTPEEYAQQQITNVYDGGGDDTAADYIPCALGNISNIITLHYSAYEGTIEEITETQQLKDSEIYFMDEDMLDTNQIAIYRTLSTAAGASWAQYAEDEAED